MKILFLTKYPPLGSSSRYRVYQFLPYYERAGLDCSVMSFHHGAYVRQYAGTRDWRPKARQVRYLLCRYVSRLLSALRAGQYDLVVVEQEVFPLVPSPFDSLIFRVAKAVVVEYDDATHIYHQHLLDTTWLRFLLHSKVSTLMARSAGVIVGNQNLATYARQYNPKVLLAPTAIDTDRYKAKKADSYSAAGSARICWIGTPLTVSYLDEIQDVLQDLARHYDVRVCVIGAPRYRIEGVPVIGMPWRLDTEVEELVSCDIGVMPLRDDAYARGKCGAKLLQYMGVGIAAVASPVGANQKIIDDGKTGFLASTSGEWTRALERLVIDVNLRKELGRAARERVEHEFALSTTASRLVAFFQELA